MLDDLSAFLDRDPHIGEVCMILFEERPIALFLDYSDGWSSWEDSHHLAPFHAADRYFALERRTACAACSSEPLDSFREVGCEEWLELLGDMEDELKLG